MIVKCLVLIGALSLAVESFAQSHYTNEPASGLSDSAYRTVDQRPQFPGGKQALEDFIQSQINYSSLQCTKECQVEITCIIQYDGSVSHPAVIAGVSPEYDAEALRVFNLLPKFKPGLKNGKAVAVYYSDTVVFHNQVMFSQESTEQEFEFLTYAESIQASPTVETHNPHNGNQAEFVGGEEALTRFTQKNIVYPDSALDHNVEGTVVLSLVIETDGSVSDIKIKKSVSRDVDAEAIRVAKLLPKFKPGMQQGKPVRTDFDLHIRFTLL